MVNIWSILYFRWNQLNLDVSCHLRRRHGASEAWGRWARSDKRRRAGIWSQRRAPKKNVGVIEWDFVVIEWDFIVIE